MRFVKATHPESIRQVLKRSFRLYLCAFWQTLPFAFILCIIAFGPRIVTLILHKDIFFGITFANPLRLLMIVIELLSLLLFATILERIRCVMDRLDETPIEDVGISLKKLPLMFCASLIQSIIFILMSLGVLGFYFFLHSQNLIATTNRLHMFLVTWPVLFQLAFDIYIFVLFIFYLPLIVTENKGILSSLIRSAKLVYRNWWRTLKTQITPWIFYFIAMLIIRYILKMNIHFYFIQTFKLSWTATTMHIVLFTLFISWSAATLLVQLRDLEMRKKLLPSK